MKTQGISVGTRVSTEKTLNYKKKGKAVKQTQKQAAEGIEPGGSESLLRIISIVII